MNLTKKMYLLAKEVVKEYENQFKKLEVIEPQTLANTKGIAERVSDFYNEVHKFFYLYETTMLNDFYDYWSEHGQNDKKFRKEKEKSFNLELRLKTWHKRSKQYNQQKPQKQNAGDILKQRYGLS